ncbi:MAG: TonB-dependent receptor [Rikenellaceae bacterium]
MKQLKSSLMMVLVAIFAINTTLFAQSRLSTISGVVIDKDANEPLIGATVTIKDSTKGDVTDDKGSFDILNVKNDGTVIIQVNFMGYKTQEIEFKPVAGKNTLKDKILLEADRVNVDEVVVMGSAPTAQQLGDTTQFNAGAFKTNPDATAEDLLAKMPGFSVTDGKAEAGGEEITQVYVDGKAYFKDDPMSALSSLPADAIESIQLFDEKSDESRFTGVDDGDRAKTINIVTKAKKSEVQMGDFIGGYGTEGRYNTKANLNYFKDDHRFTFGFGMNNINQSALSGSRFYGRSSSSGIKEAAGVKFNYSGDFKKDDDHKTELSFNYTFDRNQTDVVSSSTKDALYSDEIYYTNSNTSNLSMRHNFRLDLESTQGNNMIYFRPYAYITDAGGNNYEDTVREEDGITQNDASTYTHTGSDGYTVGGSLTWLHKISEKSSLTTRVNAKFSKTTSDTFLEGNSATYNSNIDTMVDSLINQDNNVHSGTNTIGGSVGYTYAITPNQGLNIEYRADYDWSDSDNKTYVLDRLTNEYYVYDDLSNVFERDYLTQEAGLGYSLKGENVNFSARANYQNSDLQSNLIYPSEEQYDYNFNSVKLFSRMDYDITESKRFTLFYSGRPSLPSVTQLQDVLDNTDPLQVSKGNPYLAQGYSNELSLSYSSSNMQKSTMVRLFANVNNSINGFANSVTSISQDTTINGVTVQSGAQLTVPVNVDGYWSVRAGGIYSFPLNGISSKMNLMPMYYYSRQPSVVDNVLNYSKNNTGSLNAMIISNISQNLDFTVSNRFSVTNSTSTNTASTPYNYISNATGVSANWILFNHLVLNADYSFNYYYYSTNAPDESPYYNMLNAGIGYKFMGGKSELRISAYDLLNESKSYSHSVGDIYITDSVSQVLERYFMLTYSFKFNSMTSGYDKGPSSDRGPGGPGSGGPGGGGPGSRYM